MREGSTKLSLRQRQQTLWWMTGRSSSHSLQRYRSGTRGILWPVRSVEDRSTRMGSCIRYNIDGDEAHVDVACERRVLVSSIGTTAPVEVVRLGPGEDRCRISEDIASLRGLYLRNNAPRDTRPTLFPCTNESVGGGPRGVLLSCSMRSQIPR